MRGFTCGVPQGAVLSPTLFSIFINDIPSRFCEKKGQFSLLYADDLILLAKFGNTTKGVEKETNKYLEKWSSLWRLRFAPHLLMLLHNLCQFQEKFSCQNEPKTI